MLCPVLFTSNLAEIMQVLLPEFHDLQLAITSAPVQRWVQMRGEVNYPGLFSQDEDVFRTLQIQRGRSKLSQ